MKKGKGGFGKFVDILTEEIYSEVEDKFITCDDYKDCIGELSKASLDENEKLIPGEKYLEEGERRISIYEKAIEFDKQAYIIKTGRLIKWGGYLSDKSYFIIENAKGVEKILETYEASYWETVEIGDVVCVIGKYLDDIFFADIICKPGLLKEIISFGILNEDELYDEVLNNINIVHTKDDEEMLDRVLSELKDYIENINIKEVIGN